jgi:hypothetical protein
VLRARVARDLTAVTNQLHQLVDQLFPECLPCFGRALHGVSCRRLLAAAATSIGLREGTAPLRARLTDLLEEDARLGAFQQALERQQAAALQAVPYAPAPSLSRVWVVIKPDPPRGDWDHGPCGRASPG